MSSRWNDLLAERGTGVLVIGEVAQTHDGSLGQAHAFIDAVARAGADAIKFQTHIADAESTPSEPWRVAFSKQDATRFDYWRRMEFTADQWAGLAKHAADVGILFLSSCFSIAAVELLDRIGMPAWKIASGEVGNAELLDRCASTKAPVLLSSGLSGYAELDVAVDRVRSGGAEPVVLQCATSYPCPPEAVGLNVLPELRERYGCPVGLSDHSATVYPGLAAVALGAEVIEVHVTLSREMFGPDVAASITTGELAQLVDGARFIGTMLANPVDKDVAAASREDLRLLFTRSAVAAQDMPAGRRLVSGDLVAKKPGSGIPAGHIPELLGRRLRRSVLRDHLLALEDLEPNE